MCRPHRKYSITSISTQSACIAGLTVSQRNYLSSHKQPQLGEMIILIQSFVHTIPSPPFLHRRYNFILFFTSFHQGLYNLGREIIFPTSQDSSANISSIPIHFSFSQSLFHFHPIFHFVTILQCYFQFYIYKLTKWSTQFIWLVQKLKCESSNFIFHIFIIHLSVDRNTNKLSWAINQVHICIDSR